MSRMLESFGPKRLDVAHGGLALDTQFDKDAGCNQPCSPGAAFAVDGQRGVRIEQGGDLFAVTGPGRIEVS